MSRAELEWRKKGKRSPAGEGGKGEEGKGGEGRGGEGKGEKGKGAGKTIGDRFFEARRKREPRRGTLALLDSPAVPFDPSNYRPFVSQRVRPGLPCRVHDLTGSQMAEGEYLGLVEEHERRKAEEKKAGELERKNKELEEKAEAQRKRRNGRRNERKKKKRNLEKLRGSG